MENHSLQPGPNSVNAISEQIKNMSQKELLELRNKIDQTLGTEIKDFNLGEEMGLLFRQAQDLLAKVLPDPLVPSNQKAQVFNAVKAQIDRIVALREKIYSQERFKIFEGALIKIVNMAGNEDKKKEFLHLYAEFLDNKGE
jgi:uncharacterized protein (DUF1697 family)